MLLLKLIYYPNILLRQKTKSVNKINFKVKNIIYNMFKIMYLNKGIGLAATQIGINKKIFIIDIFQNKKRVFINPKILKKKGKIYFKEGCLSIPGVFNIIKRYSYIKILALNKKNNFFKLKTKGIEAVCIQHEIDHLNGKLFIDYL
ncbi:MAG: peptide deformylase [Enterobacteriaceae bacterium PSpicST2]|nr:MAG: peptide deformylase [Enterobacteriaceae bacterium PSpicST2]